MKVAELTELIKASLAEDSKQRLTAYLTTFEWVRVHGLLFLGNSASICLICAYETTSLQL